MSSINYDVSPQPRSSDRTRYLISVDYLTTRLPANALQSTRSFRGWNVVVRPSFHPLISVPGRPFDQARCWSSASPRHSSKACGSPGRSSGV